MTRRLRQDTQRADERIVRLEAEIEQLRRQRLRNRVELAGVEERGLAGQPATVMNDLTLTSEPATMTGELSAEVFLPRPARESNLRFEQSATDSQRRDSVFSPPYSYRFRNGRMGERMRTDAWETIPPLSTGFAPAHRALTDTSLGRDSMNVNTAASGVETPPDSDINEYPPLRRMPRMSPRPTSLNPTRDPPAAADNIEELLQGLDDDNTDLTQESTWQTILEHVRDSHRDDEIRVHLDRARNLLTTDSSPSTATSFASDIAPSSSNLRQDNTAGARNYSQTSNSSSNTSLSFGEIATMDNAGENCDVDLLPPGISQREAQLIRDRHNHGPISIPDDVMEEFERRPHQPRRSVSSLYESIYRTLRTTSPLERYNEWGELERLTYHTAPSPISRRQNVEYDLYTTPSIVDLNTAAVRVLAETSPMSGARLEHGIFRAIRWRLAMGYGVPEHWWNRIGLRRPRDGAERVIRHRLEVGR